MKKVMKTIVTTRRRCVITLFATESAVAGEPEHLRRATVLDRRPDAPRRCGTSSRGTRAARARGYVVGVVGQLSTSSFTWSTSVGTNRKPIPARKAIAQHERDAAAAPRRFTPRRCSHSTAGFSASARKTEIRIQTRMCRAIQITSRTIATAMIVRAARAPCADGTGPGAPGSHAQDREAVGRLPSRA